MRSKRKIIAAFVLVLTILLSATGYAAEDSTLAMEPDRTVVTDVVTGYLNESAYARYFYEKRDLDQYTILTVPASERNALMNKVSSYSSFRDAQPILPYEEANICSGEVSPFLENLALHQDGVAYFACINELEGITYKYFNPSYSVVSVNIDKNLAAVDLYETLDFQYSDCDEPSMVMTHYFVSLVNYDGQWLILAIESDDPFYEEYCESGVDLQREIDGIVSAYARNENLRTKQRAAQETPVNPGVISGTVSEADREYIPQNAVNYAMTYSTSTDNKSGPPTYKNDKFYWSSASCQLFVSQCIWAGFGGSNTEADINEKRGMDTDGAYQWWSTKTAYNTGGSGWNSWLLCNQFRKYVDYVKNTPTESGIVCDTYEVAYNSNDLVGDSGLTKDDLVGAALHVKGSSKDKDGNVKEVPLGHAVFVNHADGTTRSTVYVTYYNSYRKNVLLSTFFPKSTTNTNNKILVMVPRLLRGCNVETGNYLYGDLQNALVRGASGVTVTLFGRAKKAVKTLTMEVYAPGDTTARYTFYAYNTTAVGGSVLFNKSGEWKVVVSAANLRPYTYVVRVVD